MAKRTKTMQKLEARAKASSRQAAMLSREMGLESRFAIVLSGGAGVAGPFDDRDLAEGWAKRFVGDAVHWMVVEMFNPAAYR